MWVTVGAARWEQAVWHHLNFWAKMHIDTTVFFCYKIGLYIKFHSGPVHILR